VDPGSLVTFHLDCLILILAAMPSDEFDKLLEHARGGT
jgi:hypothetical protein